MSRYAAPADDDQEPVTWLAGHAIYGAHLVVVVFVVSLLGTTLLLTLGGNGFLTSLLFSGSDVLRGQVWRVVSYGLVNPPSLWFIVDMFMIVWFGRELEKFFGRRTFFALFGGLYLITPLLLTAFAFRWPLTLGGAPGALALFTAFATLYPNITLSFGILAKWAAALLIGIYALIHLSNHQWPQLLALAATNGFAYLFVRYEQGNLTWSGWSALRPRSFKPEAVQERPTRLVPRARDDQEALTIEMDALLDQIARSGIGSLTPQQRGRLEAGRKALMSRRGQPPR